MSNKPWVLDFCTVPSKEVLPELNEVGAKVLEFLGELADLIREVVSFGTQVFLWSRHAGEGITDREEGTAWAVGMMQVRWTLELLLGVEAQLRCGSADAAYVTLRALLEARLSLQYLLEAPRPDKAYAYLVCEKQRELQFLQQLDPEHPRGKEYLQLLKEQHIEVNLPKPVEELREDAERIKATLNSSGPAAWKRAVEEFERLGKARPHWYSFYGGPPDMRRLAIYLRQGATYEVFYRLWSAAVHSTNLLARMRPVGDIGFTIQQLRHPSQAQEVAARACQEGLHVIQMAIEAFAPNRKQDWGAWYRRVRAAFLFLCSRKRVLHEQP